MKARASFAAWYALGILSVAVLYAVVDRQVLMLLAPPLKADLGLTDTQIGSLQGLGAVLFSAIAVIPLGWLADRFDRRLVLAGCIIVWSSAIAACGFANSYATLLLCVAFLAAGEAGLTPVVFAMIPEIFPERQRVTANFIYYAATILGSGAGVAIAGAVVQNIDQVVPFAPTGVLTRETWRLVFLAVAVPGPFLAMAILLIRLKKRARPKDAEVTAAAPAGEHPSALLIHLKGHWKAIVGVFAPYGLALLGVTAIFTWLPVILMRQFGLSAGSVGAGLGSAIAIGSVVGLGTAAVLANWLRKRWGAIAPLRLSQFGYLIYALLCPLYFLAPSADLILVIATLQMAAGIGGNSMMPTLMQDLAPAPLRGRVFATSTVIAALFQVASPISVGLLSDHVFTRPDGLLTSAIAVAGPALFVAFLALRAAEKDVLKTVGTVRPIPQEATAAALQALH